MAPNAPTRLTRLLRSFPFAVLVGLCLLSLATRAWLLLKPLVALPRVP